MYAAIAETSKKSDFFKNGSRAPKRSQINEAPIPAAPRINGTKVRYSDQANSTPAHERPTRNVVKLEMKRKPPSQSTRRSFSLSDVLTVSILTKRSTEANPMPQKGRLIRKAHLQVAFSACERHQISPSKFECNFIETYKKPSNERTQDCSNRPGDKDQRKPLRSLPQRNDIGEDDLSSHNDAATADTLDTAPCKKNRKPLSYSTDD